MSNGLSSDNVTAGREQFQRHHELLECFRAADDGLTPVAEEIFAEINLGE